MNSSQFSIDAIGAGGPSPSTLGISARGSDAAQTPQVLSSQKNPSCELRATSYEQPDLYQARSSKLVARWLKFNLVGVIGIGVQLTALAVFRSVLHLDYLVATALAVETAVIHNFLWHERFTWADRPARRLLHSLARLAKFNLSNGLVSLVGNVIIMRALVGGFGMNYVVANLIAVATCSLLNFLLSDRVVFES